MHYIVHKPYSLTGHVMFHYYRETRIKYVLDTSQDESLLTYNQTRLFHFSPNTSSPEVSEDDTICTINLPLVVYILLKLPNIR